MRIIWGWWCRFCGVRVSMVSDDGDGFGEDGGAWLLLTEANMLASESESEDIVI